LLQRLTNRLREARHRWAHRLHWQRGYVVSGWSDDALWIGFRCIECGEVHGEHIAEWRNGVPVTGARPPQVWQR
jgi:hypothetical protein